VAETREKTVVLICCMCFEYYLVMIYIVLDIDTSVGFIYLEVHCNLSHRLIPSWTRRRTPASEPMHILNHHCSNSQKYFNTCVGSAHDALVFQSPL
jgi:hypothetical protein